MRASLLFATVMSLSVIMLLGAALPGWAAFGDEVDVDGLPEGKDLGGRISAIAGAAVTLVAIIAAIGIIYGGFRYITAFGDEDGAAKGKKAVLYSIIGLILVGLSAVIVNWVISKV